MQRLTTPQLKVLLVKTAISQRIKKTSVSKRISLTTQATARHRGSSHKFIKFFHVPGRLVKHYLPWSFNKSTGINYGIELS